MFINKVMKILPLLERRRNPEHPSQQTREYRGIKAIKQKYADAGLYVTFTSVPKVGVNPKSEHNTPIGIYTYSTKYLSGLDTIDDVPYAGDSENLYVVKPTKPILYLSTYDNLEEDKAKLYEYMDEFYDEDSDHDLVFDRVRETRSHKNRAASVMWQMVRLLSIDLSERLGRNQSVLFNTILRKVLGYDILDDDIGQGIIHPGERFQCVFLSKDALSVVEKIKNHKGYEHRSLDPSRQLDQTRRHIIYRDLKAEFDKQYKAAFADMKNFMDNRQVIMADIAKAQHKSWDDLATILAMLDHPGIGVINFVEEYMPLNYDLSKPKRPMSSRMSNADLANLDSRELLIYDNLDKVMSMVKVVVDAYKDFNGIHSDRVLSQLGQ